MAGLQYNFFPTDFYYPRPQSAPFNDGARIAAVTIKKQKKESVPFNDAARVAAVTIKTQKKEVSSDDLEWPRSLGFRVHKGKNIMAMKDASMHQNQGKAYVEDEGKVFKYSPNPLSLLTLIPEEL